MSAETLSLEGPIIGSAERECLTRLAKGPVVQVWPVHVLGLCAAMMESIAALSQFERLGAIHCTATEREQMATDLEHLSRCALQLAAQIREGKR